MGLIKQAAEMARETKQCTEFVQKLSVLQWVLTFLFMGVACTVLMVYLLFTSLWLFPVLYTIWMLIDWNTPERGRAGGWVKNWAVWTHLRNYFPVKIVKTAELSPNRNYILGSHPHGIMCAGAFTSFCTGCSGFSQAFPGMRPTLAILAGLFKMPLYREYLMSAVYSFGENELFKQVVFPEGSVMRVLQTAFKKVMGFAPCLFIGQSWGLVPYSVPVTTVVGSPISVPQVSRPSEEMVDHYHSLYMEALTQLFHAHKTSCGLSDTHQLQII
ncbi:hypothetical protein ANANG_G00166210 [Anguilla anguilla]|uniref:diacylglycerol O-acyltransferase n=1 Tax=Anguilla anguilla TaxID=7936 RepID=A0A9D3RVK5_ANGAN|nr:hypothetical protein ANANG_G00166210 [Anguilla anguilla]